MLGMGQKTIETLRKRSLQSFVVRACPGLRCRFLSLSSSPESLVLMAEEYSQASSPWEHCKSCDVPEAVPQHCCRTTGEGTDLLGRSWYLVGEKTG